MDNLSNNRAKNNKLIDINLEKNNTACKDISIKHYERLIEELNCPGCSNVMKSPIYLCKSGHSICQLCVRLLTVCPLCEKSFTNIRSLTVEALCSKAYFKCQNIGSGCKVRLQKDLLPWHEKQCKYKTIKCLMGQVWGDCVWSGQELDWKNHLEISHANKLNYVNVAIFSCDMSTKTKALSGIYVFLVYDEMFIIYEIHDKDRILFSVTCTSPQKMKKHKFGFKISILHKKNESLVTTQKFPIHSEYDADIFAEGTCASFNFNDINKFIDDEKFIHYRVKIIELKSIIHNKSNRGYSSTDIPMDFQFTQVVGVDEKNDLLNSDNYLKNGSI